MAVLFFDTSALVKRYDLQESGAERVRALCRQASGHTLVISRITSVEVASALNRKLREGRLTAARRDGLWRLFRVHCRDQYRVVAVDDDILRAAERLLFAHPIRAYDAVQLASALRVATLLEDLVSDVGFCTGDRTQAAAAQRERLAVEPLL